MIKKVVSLVTLVIITGAFWFAQFQYPNDYLEKGFYTFLAVTILYFVFKSVVEEIVVRNIKEAKARYSFRKTVSILYIVGIVLALIRIWVVQTQTLLVSYGLIAAGIAIALQDFFKNFVGGILIFVTGIYRVGDRIELNAKIGDVIDIGILYTTLLELREWVAGDQATGRHEAASTIRRIIAVETKTMADEAEKEILKLGEKYYLTIRAVEPEIYLTLTDNWITFHIRYITDVRQRRVIRNKLGQLILEEIRKSDKVKIASATVDIVGFPELRLQQTS
jgi:small-conductance mechanosensitive channel